MQMNHLKCAGDEVGAGVALYPDASAVGMGVTEVKAAAAANEQLVVSQQVEIVRLQYTDVNLTIKLCNAMTLWTCWSRN